MKKLTALFLTSLLLITGCSSSGSPSEEGGTQTAAGDNEYSSRTLKFYNWGEYIGDDVISNFEKEYDVDVISEYFGSSQAMYTMYSYPRTI